MSKLRWWLYWNIGAHRREKIRLWIAWHTPKWLVYMCAIRVWANATSGQFGNVHPDSVQFSSAITTWSNGVGGDPTNR